QPELDVAIHDGILLELVFRAVTSSRRFVFLEQLRVWSQASEIFPATRPGRVSKLAGSSERLLHGLRSDRENVLRVLLGERLRQQGAGATRYHRMLGFDLPVTPPTAPGITCGRLATKQNRSGNDRSPANESRGQCYSIPCFQSEEIFGAQASYKKASAPRLEFLALRRHLARCRSYHR